MEKIKIGITHGDINGIGNELIIKTLRDNRINDICIPIVYGSPKVLAYHRKAINIDNFSLQSINSAAQANPKNGNIINCLDDNIRVELGKSTEEAGTGSYLPLKQAVKDLKEGLIDVLVTAPINKHNIKEAGFNFPGHTEYLANEFDIRDFLMLLVNDQIRVGVVTGHIPIKDVAQNITKEKILNKLKVLNQTLQVDFGIRKPRIAVLGLNPHAGDNDLLGKEETEIIKPAINEANDLDIMAVGPYPADGLFGSELCFKFDAILAMYHDQGLAPFKAIAFDEGVNYTAGLPIVRTSPDHGTAYEIAGQGIANIQSFRNAIYLAIDIFKKRRANLELLKNSLEKSDELNHLLTGKDEDISLNEVDD
ncbi:MAG TPA: 4-hydroxythreonine-4-phosphate dehydrogenase PdxA [Bacteroidales bacterium]|nr:4-hydroxythreonine-4-phosphate dehydrogenase PdxA [Bacteroidales bacterium]HXK82651.1 4-hydroxythreonine-4-phosphate dehydrogenase PdxA [Bacteroidales bacterium]